MHKYRESFSTFNQWFAFSISIIASVFFLFFEVGEEVSFLNNNFELLKLVRLIALMAAICGSGLSFFYRKIGAICMIVGGLGLVVWHLLQSPPEPQLSILYGVLFLVPGGLLLLPKSKK